MATPRTATTAGFGQSPFAISRGNRFEAGLFYDDAAKLRVALERRACLPTGSTGFVGMRALHPDEPRPPQRWPSVWPTTSDRGLYREMGQVGPALGETTLYDQLQARSPSHHQ